MKVQNDMTALTTTANSATATFVTLTALKQTLELAEKLHIPSEELKDSYSSVEELTIRVKTVS